MRGIEFYIRNVYIILHFDFITKYLGRINFSKVFKRINVAKKSKEHFLFGMAILISRGRYLKGI